MNLQDLFEFAPDEGGGSRKFIPWPEFIEQLKQILHKDFSCKENVVKSTIKARFVPHDPMEYGPTMLYSYYETRAGGRNKGAVSTRGSIQVGKYTKGGLFGQNPDQLLTGFHLLKGHPFERHFDLTFDNIYKIANIIQGNTEGALEFQPQQQGVAEGLVNEGQYEMMMRNGQVKKFIAKDDADAKRIAAGHGAKSVIKLKGNVPAGKVAEQGVAEMDGDGAGRDGSNRKRISTYGTRDRDDVSNGPDVHLGPEHVMAPKKVVKHGVSALHKAWDAAFKDTPKKRKNK
jgi:hypothetical protein